MLSIIYLCILPLGSGGQPYNADIHELAACGADGWRCRHRHRWALTPPSHLYLVAKEVVLFSATKPSQSSPISEAQCPVLSGLSSLLCSNAID